MDGEGIEVGRKQAMEDKEWLVEDGAAVDSVEEPEIKIAGSEVMELNISHILGKIENFTRLVSELLESGKTLLKGLSDEFEEQMIIIHKAQVEKWQEEIRELRILDASNEEVNALLHNARYLIQSIHIDP